MFIPSRVQQYPKAIEALRTCIHSAVSVRGVNAERLRLKTTGYELPQSSASNIRMLALVSWYALGRNATGLAVLVVSMLAMSIVDHI